MRPRRRRSPSADRTGGRERLDHRRGRPGPPPPCARPGPADLGQLPGQRRDGWPTGCTWARCGGGTTTCSRCARATWPTRPAQPRCSRLPLASIAARLRDDPLTAWVEEAGALRVFAEACGRARAPCGRPRGGGRRSCGRPRPGRWLKGCRRRGLRGPRAGGGGRRLAAAGPPRGSPRAGCARLNEPACRSSPSTTTAPVGSSRPQADAVLAEAFLIGGRWPAIRRSEHTVMGPRCSFRPMLRQRPDGDWSPAGPSRRARTHRRPVAPSRPSTTSRSRPVRSSCSWRGTGGRRPGGALRGRARRRDRRPCGSVRTT